MFLIRQYEISIGCILFLQNGMGYHGETTCCFVVFVVQPPPHCCYCCALLLLTLSWNKSIWEASSVKTNLVFVVVVFAAFPFSSSFHGWHCVSIDCDI